jgi:flavin reductase (DIM6/NTAB) family NADH-FMN oxidoreductase RutF
MELPYIGMHYPWRRGWESMNIDLEGMNKQDLHHLLTCIVVPRPIAWVSTVDKEGVFNLAPFSAYCVMSFKPPVVGFCVSPPRDGAKKDTLKNIVLTGEFVINVVDETLVDAMNITAIPYPGDTDEFKEAGLTPVNADVVKVPMVLESPVQMECRLNRILEFGESPMVTGYVIGDVLCVHVKDELYAGDEIQVDKLRAVGRLGGRGRDLYCRTTDSFEVQRPA